MQQRQLFTLSYSSFTVWVALWIAVFGAFAPTLSHALVWARGGTSPIVQVCTDTGPRWVALKTSTDSPDAPQAARTLEHCPFCLLFADHVAPPPSPLGHLFAKPGDFEAPLIRPFFFLPPPFH